MEGWVGLLEQVWLKTAWGYVLLKEAAKEGRQEKWCWYPCMQVIELVFYPQSLFTSNVLRKIINVLTVDQETDDLNDQ